MGATGRCLCGAGREHFATLADGGLRWIDSPNSAAHTRRGFCGECGSSLFWDAPDRDTTSIAAGTLDEPTGLVTVRQIYVADAGDYHESPRASPRVRTTTASRPARGSPARRGVPGLLLPGIDRKLGAFAQVLQRNIRGSCFTPPFRGISEARSSPASARP